MICEEVMKSSVKCVSPETTVEQAAELMRDEGVGFLPVCDEGLRVIGTITDRDITIRTVAGHEDPSQPVAKFMTNDVVACRSTDDLSYALELMSQEKVSRMLCVNESGNIEGVISLSDIAQLQDAARAWATLRNVSERETRI